MERTKQTELFDYCCWLEQQLAATLVASACRHHPVTPPEDPFITVRMTPDNCNMIARLDDGQVVKWHIDDGTAALRQSFEGYWAKLGDKCGTTSTVEAMRETLAIAYTDISEWLQLAERQAAELPNADHNPLAPTTVGIERSRRVQEMIGSALLLANGAS